MTIYNIVLTEYTGSTHIVEYSGSSAGSHLIYLYADPQLEIFTGEVKTAVEAIHNVYQTLGLRYLPDVTKINTETAGLYDAVYNYTGQIFKSEAETNNVLYRFMYYTPYRSVWSSSSGDTSYTLLKYFQFKNTKDVCIGIIGDNFFNIDVEKDGTSVMHIECDPTPGGGTLYLDRYFKYSHLFPLTVERGSYKFIFRADNLGGPQSIGVIIWDLSLFNYDSATFPNGPMEYLIGDLTSPYSTPYPTPKSNWAGRILYSSEEAITFGIYMASGTTIHVDNYLGVEYILEGIYTYKSWIITWGDTSSSSGTTVASVKHKYASTGNYTVEAHITLNNDTVVDATPKSITVI
jgi:hypothetical protein